VSALDRRTLLKGAAVASAAGALPFAAEAAAPAARLVVYDSRIAESRDFAMGIAAAHRLDLAAAHDSQWAGLRGALPAVTRIEGLTGWSDWVAVRGELAARGLRTSAEDRVAAPLSGKAHLLRWSMQAR